MKTQLALVNAGYAPATARQIVEDADSDGPGMAHRSEDAQMRISRALGIREESDLDRSNRLFEEEQIQESLGSRNPWG